MSDPNIKSYEEFWPYYVRAHTHKGNRMLLFAGSSAALTLAAAALVTGKPMLLLAAPIVGYGAAWIGHFGIEKNVPATFGHPLWSLASDFVMWWKIAAGTMDEEVERYTRAPEAPQEHASSGNGHAAEPSYAAPVSAPAPDPRTLN